MQAIGEKLREARMRQKIDIAEVETATKIRAKYLRALENEEFDILPGSTFIKTFLRTYAEYLGLDAQLLVEEYRAQYEPRGEAEPMQSFAPSQPPKQRGPRFGGAPGPGTAIIVLVLALLVVFAILGLTGDNGDEAGDTGTDTTEQRQTAREREKARERKRRARRRRATAKSVSLRVVPSDATYLCVDGGRGTRVIYEGTLDGPRTFRGKRLRINLGRSSASLRVNGRAVRYQRGPASVGFDFRPGRGAKRLPEPQRPCV